MRISSSSGENNQGAICHHTYRMAGETSGAELLAKLPSGKTPVEGARSGSGEQGRKQKQQIEAVLLLGEDPPPPPASTPTSPDWLYSEGK